MNPNELNKKVDEFSVLVLSKFEEQFAAMQRLDFKINQLQTGLAKMECSLALLDIQEPTVAQFEQWLSSKNQAADEILAKYQKALNTNMKTASDLLSSFFKNLGK